MKQHALVHDNEMVRPHCLKGIRMVIIGQEDAK